MYGGGVKRSSERSRGLLRIYSFRTIHGGLHEIPTHMWRKAAGRNFVDLSLALATNPVSCSVFSSHFR